MRQHVSGVSLWRRAGVACALVLLLPGCRRADDTNRRLMAAIDHYYDSEPACLWFSPVRLPEPEGKGDAVLRAQLGALARVGLLAEGGEASHATYTLTPAGQGFWRAVPEQPGSGNFCYGRPHTTAIDGTSDRQDEVFGKVRDVDYHAAITESRGWTYDGALGGIFPQLRSEATGALPHSATLKQEDGEWKVAAGPSYSLPFAPAAAGSGAGHP